MDYGRVAETEVLIKTLGILHEGRPTQRYRP
jgi:hypothetical protein